MEFTFGREGRSGRLTIPIRAAFNKKLKPKKDFFRKIEVNLHRHFHSTPFKHDLTEVTQLHFKLFFHFSFEITAAYSVLLDPIYGPFSMSPLSYWSSLEDYIDCYECLLLLLFWWKQLKLLSIIFFQWIVSIFSSLQSKNQLIKILIQLSPTHFE